MVTAGIEPGAYVTAGSRTTDCATTPPTTTGLETVAAMVSCPEALRGSRRHSIGLTPLHFQNKSMGQSPDISGPSEKDKFSLYIYVDISISW